MPEPASDGVRRVVERRGGGVQRGALVGLAALCLGLLVWVLVETRTHRFARGVGGAARPVDRGDRGRAGSSFVDRANDPRRDRGDDPPALTVIPEPTDEVPEGPVEAPSGVADPPADPGSGRRGLALFVPGTKPILRGIVVPEDFALPPGYVRHYQTTDDGQMLPAILMFHPDHHPTDAAGRPIPLPPDRVVPPALAPPGLPLRMLEVPSGGGRTAQ